MKRFVEEYPEFKKLGGNVSKHVALVGELSRIVERDGLLTVSEVEQSLASNESHTADLKVSLLGAVDAGSPRTSSADLYALRFASSQSVLNLLSTASIPNANKLRLAILYALRYQKFSANAIPHVVDSLITNGIEPDRARVGRLSLPLPFFSFADSFPLSAAARLRDAELCRSRSASR